MECKLKRTVNPRPQNKVWQLAVKKTFGPPTSWYLLYWCCRILLELSSAWYYCLYNQLVQNWLNNWRKRNFDPKRRWAYKWGTSRTETTPSILEIQRHIFQGSIRYASILSIVQLQNWDWTRQRKHPQL